MANKSSTHSGNCFYTLASIDTLGGAKRSNASSPYLRMRRAETAISAVVRAAADPNVVAFPVRRAFRCGNKSEKQNLAEI